MSAFAVEEKRAIAIRLIASGAFSASQWMTLSNIVRNDSIGMLPDGRLVSRQRPVRPPKEHLSLDEAAGVAGVHPVTIRRWVKAGMLARSSSDTARFIVHREDLERLLRQRRPE